MEFEMNPALGSRRRGGRRFVLRTPLQALVAALAAAMPTPAAPWAGHTGGGHSAPGWVCVGGQCYPNPVYFGHYQQSWRRWPTGLGGAAEPTAPGAIPGLGPDSPLLPPTDVPPPPEEALRGTVPHGVVADIDGGRPNTTTDSGGRMVRQRPAPVVAQRDGPPSSPKAPPRNITQAAPETPRAIPEPTRAAPETRRLVPNELWITPRPVSRAADAPPSAVSDLWRVVGAAGPPPSLPASAPASVQPLPPMTREPPPRPAAEKYPSNPNRSVPTSPPSSANPRVTRAAPPQEHDAPRWAPHGEAWATDLPTHKPADATAWRPPPEAAGLVPRRPAPFAETPPSYPADPPASFPLVERSWAGDPESTRAAAPARPASEPWPDEPLRRPSDTGEPQVVRRSEPFDLPEDRVVPSMTPEIPEMRPTEFPPETASSAARAFASDYLARVREANRNPTAETAAARPPLNSAANREQWPPSHGGAASPAPDSVLPAGNLARDNESLVRFADEAAAAPAAPSGDGHPLRPSQALTPLSDGTRRGWGEEKPKPVEPQLDMAPVFRRVPSHGNPLR